MDFGTDRRIVPSVLINPTRRDVILIHSADVIVDEKLRGRHKAPNKAEVISLAESILEHGQLQNAQIRKRSDDKAQLVYGYTRYLTIQHLHDEGHSS